MQPTLKYKDFSKNVLNLFISSRRIVVLQYCVGFCHKVDISLGGLKVHFNTDLSFPEPATSLGQVRYPKQESLNKLMSLQTVFFLKVHNCI